MITEGINRGAVLAASESFLLELLKLRAGDSSKEICQFCQNAFQSIPGLHLTKKIPGEVAGEFNMEFTWSGFGQAKPIYLHAWMDDLPQPKEGAVVPKVVDGYICGTGAAAGKGGVAALYGLMWELSSTYLRFPFDVKVHLTIGQRRGSKGCAALAAEADGQAVILMEPTSRNIVTRHVGALWLKLVSTGIACHTSVVQVNKSKSAFEKMIDLLDELEAAHAEYAAAVRSDSDLKPYFNVGGFTSGIWIGAPSPRAEAKVALTIVPSDKTAAYVERCMKIVKDNDVEAEILMERACGGSDELPAIFNELPECMHKARFSGWVRGSESPMDLSIYTQQAKMPAVAFGPCDPAVAATTREKVGEKALLDTIQAIRYWLERVGAK